MRSVLLGLPIALAACQAEPPQNNESEQVNNILAEIEGEKGWHYSRKADRIRKSETVMASIYSEEGSAAAGTKATLSIQANPDGSTDVFFRSDDINCREACSVAYRSGEETGRWTANGSPGLIILGEREGPLGVLKRGGTLIAELDGTQYTFETIGLKWPPPS
jgi:hypothetical protein